MAVSKKPQTPKPVRRTSTAVTSSTKTKPVRAKAESAEADVADAATYSAADLVAPDTQELPPVVKAEAEPEATKAQVKAPEPEPEPKKVVVAAPVAADPAPLAEGLMNMNDTMEVAKTVANEAKARIESMVAEFQDKSKTMVEKSTKAFEELGDLTKGNMEAMVESTKIAAKGFETMGQDAAEYSRKSFEKTTATMKSFAAVKSPSEFFQMQSELVTSMFDTMAAEASKNSEAMMKLMGDVAQPISNRVAIVSEKMKSIAA